MRRALFRVSIIVFVTTVVAVLATLILPCTLVYAEESESECWAVIVDITDYQFINDLWSGYRDGADLYQQLEPVFGEDNIRLLLNADATKADIGDTILNWLDPREDADDTVVFFFSGHGSPGYIYPYDSLLTSYANDITSFQLASWLDSLESRRMIVMINSCYSGSLINAISDSGRVILTASTANESAWGIRYNYHSHFTHFILQAIGEFETVDTNGDLNLSAEEIYSYAAPRVVALALTHGASQHPVMSDEYVGELILLIKFIFNTEPQSLHSIDVLFVDDNACSGSTELIWAPGSVHNLRVIPVHDTGRGTRYVFTSWGDGNTSASRVVSGGGEYTADYRTEYQLTFESAYGEPEGQGWYSEGSTATISVANVEEPATRHIFTGWSGGYTGDETTALVVMYSPKTITANWRNEYLLTIESAYGEPEGEGWYDEGATATISVESIEEPTVRRYFTSWSGDYIGNEETATVTIDSPKTMTVNWRSEYLLTIESAYGEPEGEGWYDEGATANISVSEIEGVIVRQIFTGWSGDFAGTTATATLTVNSAMVVTANWRTDFTQLYILIAGLVVLGTTITLIVIRVRRRGKVV